MTNKYKRKEMYKSHIVPQKEQAGIDKINR